MRNLSNVEIADFLNSFHLQNFLGIASADTVPVPLLNSKEHFSLIANLDKYGDPGTHFITLIGLPTCVLYIDTLGLPNYFSRTLWHCLTRLNRPLKSIYSMTEHVQTHESNMCGDFSAYFCIIFDKKNKEIKSRLDPFHHR